MDSETKIIKQMRTDRRAAGLNISAHEGLDRTLDQLTYLYNCALEERKEAYEKYKKLKRWGLSEDRLRVYFYPHWKSGISYNKGNTVKNLNIVYKALNSVKSDIQPCDDPLNWKMLPEEDLKKKSVSYEDQSKSLTEIREEEPVFNKVLRQIQLSVLKRLDSAYDRFFSRGGHPRFKKSSRKVRSFETRLLSKIRKQERRTSLYIKGIGRVSFKGRIPEGTRYIRIVQTALRVEIQFIYEAIVGVDRGMDRPIGIDLGVNNRIALSDGSFYKGIKTDRKELKRKQKILSRAVKGSASRKKKVQILAKEYARVAEREHYMIHEITTELSRKHNFIMAEDLKLKNMTKSAKGTVEDPGKNIKQKSGLNRSLIEQQLGKVVNQLDYKVLSTGGKLHKIPAQYTSQTCSRCGWIDKENRKGELFKCVGIFCAHTEHADTNAAKNMLKRGLSSLSGGNKDESLPMQAEYSLVPKGYRVRGNLLAEQYADHV